jgi:hypothetical protein
VRPGTHQLDSRILLEGFSAFAMWRFLRMRNNTGTIFRDGLIKKFSGISILEKFLPPELILQKKFLGKSF